MKMPSETSPAGSIPKLDDLIAQIRALVDAQLEVLLPGANISPERVHQAIRWSVFAGGKRFRSFLLLATGKTLEAPLDQLLNTAAAFEMIHTYSLIHDDLPSMDDDDLRRGVPTCHVRFDEATAILAGDALQTLAFRTIAQDSSLDAQTRVHLIEELAIAAGTPEGMVAGQALDIAGEAQSVEAHQLEEIHRKKTGALITAAARSGAIIAKASPDELAAIHDYGSFLGLLFQITDDLLDVTATVEELGKTPGKDARSLKATYPSLYGVEQSRAAAAKAHLAAHSALERINRPTTTLKQIADYILHRTA
jgi:geranylgeranyl pyrophosphate synthase